MNFVNLGCLSTIEYFKGYFDHIIAYRSNKVGSTEPASVVGLDRVIRTGEHYLLSEYGVGVTAIPLLTGNTLSYFFFFFTVKSSCVCLA